ncbi:MAG: BamA/TamA family outer membrane protein [Deltaproteobacteria bacterium]|nr:BamA/TamA family outer membrane protein [Deltaproteobacteria bacterium]
MKKWIIPQLVLAFTLCSGGLARAGDEQRDPAGEQEETEDGAQPATEPCGTEQGASPKAVEPGTGPEDGGQNAYPKAGEQGARPEEGAGPKADEPSPEDGEQGASTKGGELEPPGIADEDLNRVGLEDPFRPRYIIESIEVQGNTKTRGDLIISYLSLQPGEVLDEEEVELSRIRLLALGYFRDVRMRLKRGSERGRVTLIVEVEERNTIIIDNLFVGYSDTNPFWGGLGISDINFFGLGMALSGAFVVSENQWTLRLGVFWPSIFGTRFSAGIQGLYAEGQERKLLSKIDLPDDPEDPCHFDADQVLDYRRGGAILSTGLNLDPRHRISLQLQAEHIEASFDEPKSGTSVCENYPFSGYLRKDQSTLISLSFQFERDTRDDFFLPTQGMHLVVSVELASKIPPLFSDYEYSKYMISYEHSIRLWLDHVLRVSLVGGLLQDAGKSGSPFFKRFFVGDYAMYLIKKDSLPRNLELNFSEVVDYGDVLFSASVEYDVPLWSTGDFFYRGYLYAAVNFSYLTKAAFLATEDEWSGREKRPVSLDLGMKLDTPVGLFTFSAAYWMDVVF